jgi:hypothetical protein
LSFVVERGRGLRLAYAENAAVDDCAGFQSAFTESGKARFALERKKCFKFVWRYPEDNNIVTSPDAIFKMQAHAR